MDRETAKKHLEAYTAFANGEDIQCMPPPLALCEWYNDPNPSWLPDWEYRPKPEPLIYEQWVVVTAFGRFAFHTEMEANCCAHRQIVKARFHIFHEYEEGDGLD